MQFMVPLVQQVRRAVGPVVELHEVIHSQDFNSPALTQFVWVEFIENNLVSVVLFTTFRETETQRSKDLHFLLGQHEGALRGVLNEPITTDAPKLLRVAGVRLLQRNPGSGHQQTKGRAHTTAQHTLRKRYSERSISAVAWMRISLSSSCDPVTDISIPDSLFLSRTGSITSMLRPRSEKSNSLNIFIRIEPMTRGAVVSSPSSVHWLGSSLMPSSSRAMHRPSNPGFSYSIQLQQDTRGKSGTSVYECYSPSSDHFDGYNTGQLHVSSIRLIPEELKVLSPELMLLKYHDLKRKHVTNAECKPFQGVDGSLEILQSDKTHKELPRLENNLGTKLIGSQGFSTSWEAVFVPLDEEEALGVTTQLKLLWIKGFLKMVFSDGRHGKWRGLEAISVMFTLRKIKWLCKPFHDCGKVFRALENPHQASWMESPSLRRDLVFSLVEPGGVVYSCNEPDVVGVFSLDDPGGIVVFSLAEPGGIVVFSLAEPGGSVVFSLAEPGESVVFSLAEPGGILAFSLAESGGSVVFSLAKPGGIMVFSLAEPGESVVFSLAEPGESVVFSLAEPGGSVVFSLAEPGESVVFSLAEPGESVVFSLAEPGRIVVFSLAEPGEKVVFSLAEPGRIVVFSLAEPGESVVFSLAEPGGILAFSLAESGGSVVFSLAEPGGIMVFSLAEPGESVVFSLAEPGGIVAFSLAESGGIFSLAEPGGIMVFSLAEPGESVVFSLAEPGGSVVFSLAEPGRIVVFSLAEPGESVVFSLAEPGRSVVFSLAEPGRIVVFSLAEPGRIVVFSLAEPGDSVVFSLAKPDEIVVFSLAEPGDSVVFSLAEPGDSVVFSLAKPGGTGWFASGPSLPFLENCVPPGTPLPSLGDCSPLGTSLPLLGDCSPSGPPLPSLGDCCPSGPLAVLLLMLPTPRRASSRYGSRHLDCAHEETPPEKKKQRNHISLV
ncbi:hypothetical protein DNTS_031715 [Danionella cerebrum]|uniref:Uncharacterized protein n=1 Tax=Danionella cerebrum TaxID=2873325 RepID=A0A553QB67_9TELE|nr:hypothetical protein DNTS_031715 [Danionella translucida]